MVSSGEAMVSFLTQLRDGYLDRKKSQFPHALGLVGMRQVRDYALSLEDRRAVSWLGTTSPFNIAAEAATLRPFSRPRSASSSANTVEILILERRSHIDSLVARPREPRVVKILEPMLIDDRTGSDTLDDDFSYVWAWD